jgi:hypothetical protein
MGTGRISGYNFQELAPLNIGVTIIKPGAARTNFQFGGAQLGAQMEAYKDTPAAMVYTMIRDTSRLPPGDPAEMAMIIIDSLEQKPAPKLLEGSPVCIRQPKIMLCLWRPVHRFHEAARPSEHFLDGYPLFPRHQLLKQCDKAVRRVFPVLLLTHRHREDSFLR